MYKAALALGTANQLTNILRDVGEDSVERDRIYVPLDDLQDFGISEQEVHSQCPPPSSSSSSAESLLLYLSVQELTASLSRHTLYVTK